MRSQILNSSALIATNTTPRQLSSGTPARHVLAPLMQYHDGRLMISVDPGRLGRHPATTPTARTASHDGSPPVVVPTLTPTQQRALAVLSTAAARHRVPLNPRPGDIMLVNNWALLHARDAYVDANADGTGAVGGAGVGGGGTSRRHLLRLWLRSSRLGWTVPPAMRIPWERTFGTDGTGHIYNNTGRRRGSSGGGSGGALPVQRLYPVLPAPEYKIPKYTAGSAAFVVEDSDCGEEE